MAEADKLQNIPESSTASAEDRRLNKLTFWSVLLMDYALAFGVGRQTAIRPNDITQTLPDEDDIHPGGIVEGIPRSPFILRREDDEELWTPHQYAERWRSGGWG